MIRKNEMIGRKDCNDCLRVMVTHMRQSEEYAGSCVPVCRLKYDSSCLTMPDLPGDFGSV